jgi:hypothetical protein
MSAGRSFHAQNLQQDAEQVRENVMAMPSTIMAYSLRLENACRCTSSRALAKSLHLGFLSLFDEIELNLIWSALLLRGKRPLKGAMMLCAAKI